MLPAALPIPACRSTPPSPMPATDALLVYTVPLLLRNRASRSTEVVVLSACSQCLVRLWDAHQRRLSSRLSIKSALRGLGNYQLVETKAGGVSHAIPILPCKRERQSQ
ncbi:hypothetical protein C8Q77DRAFT_87225 [Trametes polyzona]|nr:hypothetical protein C8Q77DRAFT_87225 [Trametes polyzona]